MKLIFGFLMGVGASVAHYDYNISWVEVAKIAGSHASNASDELFELAKHKIDNQNDPSD